MFVRALLLSSASLPCHALSHQHFSWWANSAIFPGAATLRRARPAAGVKHEKMLLRVHSRLTHEARSEGALYFSKMASEKIEKLLNAEARLLDDVPQGAARNVLAGMQGHCRLTRRVSVMDEPVVTAAGANDREARSMQSADYVSRLE
jgi:hypothetical protein